jgi:hypothetical protein
MTISNCLKTIFCCLCCDDDEDTMPPTPTVSEIDVKANDIAKRHISKQSGHVWGVNDGRQAW